MDDSNSRQPPSLKQLSSINMTRATIMNLRGKTNYLEDSNSDIAEAYIGIGDSYYTNNFIKLDNIEQ